MAFVSLGYIYYLNSHFQCKTFKSQHNFYLERKMKEFTFMLFLSHRNVGQTRQHGFSTTAKHQFHQLLVCSSAMLCPADVEPEDAFEERIASSPN